MDASSRPASPACSHGALDSATNGNNMTSPIANNIPSEILVYIFQFVQSATGWKSYPSHTTPSWIPFTWVCRRWRAVALSAPVLWTSIRNAGPPNTQSWLPVFLERAGGAPLDIDITLIAGEEATSETMRTIRPYAPTIRRFYLCLDNAEGSAYSDLVSPLMAKMRDVEELTLLAFMHYGQKDAGTIHTSGDHLPHLTSLRLAGPHIPWSSFVYTKLRELRLTSIAHPPSAAEFFHILQSCPELEVLGFGTGLPTRSAQPSDTETTLGLVALPRMRDISLKGTLSEIEFVLRYIEIPPTCRIQLLLIGGYDDPIAAIIPRHWMLQPLLRTCTALSLSWNRSRINLLVAGGETEISVSCSCYIRSNYSIRSSETWTKLLKALRPSPLTRVRIALRVDDTMGPGVWLDCFSTFPLLEVLAFGSPKHTIHHSHSFLSALRTPTNLAVNAMSVPLSRLRALELIACQLNTVAAEDILTTLEHRASRGVPLSELVFTLCYCDTDVDVASLKEKLQRLATVSIRYESESSSYPPNYIESEIFQYKDPEST